MTLINSSQLGLQTLYKQMVTISYKYFELFLYLTPGIKCKTAIFRSGKNDFMSMLDSVPTPPNLIGTSIGYVITLLGGGVLLGWVFETAFILQIRPGFAPMQFNTASGFLLAENKSGILSIKLKDPGVKLNEHNLTVSLG